MCAKRGSSRASCSGLSWCRSAASSGPRLRPTHSDRFAKNRSLDLGYVSRVSDSDFGQFVPTRAQDYVGSPAHAPWSKAQTLVSPILERRRNCKWLDAGPRSRARAVGEAAAAPGKRKSKADEAPSPTTQSPSRIPACGNAMCVDTCTSQRTGVSIRVSLSTPVRFPKTSRCGYDTFQKVLVDRSTAV